jgi:hypothetical protein
MTIDIDIVPTQNNVFSCSDLKSMLLNNLDSLDTELSMRLDQSMKILELGSNREIENDQLILPTHYYYFNLGIDNTLTLSCDNNAETYTNEQEYLEDFGRNLDSSFRLQISQLWRNIGYGYSVSSYGGRAKEESTLLIAIATSIARMTQGYIIIKDSELFSIPVGVYTADEFFSCKPLF